jgi:predicted nucleotidyltransferase
MDPTLQVPPINVRKRIPAEVIQHLVSQIVEHFHPIKIILFGSYASGYPRPESDVDLLVVMDTSLRPIQQAQLIRKQLDPSFGLDLLVYTPEVLSQRLEWGDIFLREIMAKGKVIYEAPDP